MPAAKSKVRTYALAYVGLATLLLVTVTHFSRIAYDSIDLVRHANEYVRPPFYLGDANWGAVTVQPEAEAAGLSFGDSVLAVEGRPVDGYLVYYRALRQARVGDRLNVQVQRPPRSDHPVSDLSIELRPLSDADPLLRTPGPSVYVSLALSTIATPLVCIALGFWVAAVRIGDRAAWLLLVVLLSLATYSAGNNPLTLFGRESILQPLFAGFGAFFALVAAPALMLFGITFPERLPLDRRFPWLKWIVAGHLLLISTLVAIDVGLGVHHLSLARQMTQRPIQLLTGVEGDFGGAVMFIALIVCAASLGWKTMTAATRDARRRLLLLNLGAVPSVAALLTILVMGRLEISLPGWAIWPLITMMLAFPLTMAYVIVVHRAMDARVVIRQGLQYVLATRGIRVLQVVISMAIIIAAATMSATTRVTSRFIFISLGFALLAGLQGFAGWLRGWIDRRFFREAYEADVILGDLAAKVRTMVETTPLLETVAHRIAASLHIPRVAILLNERGAFRPAYTLGFASPPAVSISEESLTVRRLRKQQHAFVEFDDAESWVQLTDDAERASLEELKAELLLPLSFNEKMLGIMSLGPKQSEEPFSKTDIRLIDSVAAQTGLALENSRLTETIKTEAAARERQRRELEIAHEVQDRLFRRSIRPSPLSTMPARVARPLALAATTTTSSCCRRRSWASPSVTYPARGFRRRS